MTAKRYRVDVLNQVMDTNYDWFGHAPPFDQYVIDEDDYLVIGTVKTDKDGEAICDLLNELHEENQDLKSFNKDLAENLLVCANARISKDDCIGKLTEENEQLQKSLLASVEKNRKLQTILDKLGYTYVGDLK